MDQWVNANIRVCGYRSSEELEPGEKVQENKGPLCLKEFSPLPWIPFEVVVLARILDRRGIGRHRGGKVGMGLPGSGQNPV